MRWQDFDSERCTMQRTVELIGDKWTMLLIRDAANGVHRFDEYRRHVGLSEAVLANRLRSLVDNGLFETREYQEPGQRKRREYRLSAKGWDLFPVLIALRQFGDKHLAADVAEGPTWQILHRDCGHPVRAEVRCVHDGEVLTYRDTQPVAVGGQSEHDADLRVTL